MATLSKVRRKLGDELADKLIDAFAGSDIYIPASNYLQIICRNKAIIDAYNDGLKSPDLAKQYGISARQILRIISGKPRYRKADTCTWRLLVSLDAADTNRLISAFPGERLHVPTRKEIAYE